MEEKTTQFVIASRAALAQASNLLVDYSFSFIGAIVLLIVGWTASRLLYKWTLNSLMRLRRFDQTLAHFLANFVRYAVLIIMLVAVLGQFGVQTASILAALGAAGLAIGLALQGTLQNIAAGIMLLVLRPFSVGESIQTNDVSGTIVEVGLFATEIKTFDGLYLLVPNSSLWNKPITNYSRLPTRAFQITVTLPIYCDIREAEAALRDIIAKDERLLADPGPFISINSIQEGAFEIFFKVWTKSENFGDVKVDVSRAIKVAFDELRNWPTDPEVKSAMAEQMVLMTNRNRQN